jgi:BCD family chlorophyll transporter-like MFS transporter
MGLWGGAQSVAFGVGGAFGAVAIDLVGMVLEGRADSFACVFALEAAIFVVAARLAAGIGRTEEGDVRLPLMPAPYELAGDVPQSR